MEYYSINYDSGFSTSTISVNPQDVTPVSNPTNVDVPHPIVTSSPRIAGSIRSIKKKPFWGDDKNFLDPSVRVKENMTFLKIGGRNAFERQGLTTISATPKSGKSLSVYSMLIPCVTGKKFGNAEPVGDEMKRVIVFDTEMTPNDLARRTKLLYSIDETKTKIGFISLLQVPKSDRMDFIRNTVNKYQPDVIVIDTVARLVNDYNSSAEANRLGDFLTQLMTERSVIAIIHLTKGTEKMKGHIGSILEELAMENYQARHHNGIFELKIKNARNSDTDNAESLYFTINEGKISECESEGIEREKTEYKELKALFEPILSEQPLSRKNIIEKIQQIKGLGLSRINEIITSAIKLDIIRKQYDGHKSPYILSADDDNEFDNAA